MNFQLHEVGQPDATSSLRLSSEVPITYAGNHGFDSRVGRPHRVHEIGGVKLSFARGGGIGLSSFQLSARFSGANFLDPL